MNAIEEAGVKWLSQKGTRHFFPVDNLVEDIYADFYLFSNKLFTILLAGVLIW